MFSFIMSKCQGVGFLCNSTGMCLILFLKALHVILMMITQIWEFLR